MTEDQIAFSVVLLVIVFLATIGITVKATEPKMVTWRVWLKDGSSHDFHGADQYYTGRSGALSFWDAKGRLLMCWAPGEWIKVQRMDRT